MSVLITNLATALGSGLRYRKFTVGFADIAAIGAATSGDIALFTLPKASKILGIMVKHTAQFVVGSGTFKVSVGIAGSATLFTSATADLVATAVADTTLQETAMFKSGSIAAVPVVCNCVSQTGNLSTCTAGSVDIYVLEMPCTTPAP